jgi:glycosyltransferase involved in cell wall biosynthesis
MCKVENAPLLLVSAAGSVDAERSLETILGALPAQLRVGILAESPLHVAGIIAMARPRTQIAVIRTAAGAPFRRAVRRFIRLYLRLRPRAVLANTPASARVVAAAARWLPGLAAHAFIYVRDGQWRDIEALLPTLASATVLVPHRIFLQYPDYLDRFVIPTGPMRAMVLPDTVAVPDIMSCDPGPDAPVLHLATVAPGKGHVHLIGAMAWLRAGGMNLRAHSFGDRPDPALLRSLLSQIAALDLGGAISLHDQLPDPAPVLRSCLCVVDTSVSHSGSPEIFGRGIIEAWAHARPVVAFAAGAPARLIRHGIDGLLVPEGDEQALGEALLQLRRDPELRLRLGKNGLARVRTEFEARHVVGQWLAAIDADRPRHQKTLPDKPAAPPTSAAEPRTRVLLDLTHTLRHGWRTPVGLTRVEQEVRTLLCADPALDVTLVRYDPASTRFRGLSPLEQHWLDHGDAWLPPDSPPLASPRNRVRAWIGMASTILPGATRRPLASVWRRLLRSCHALRRPASALVTITPHSAPATLPDVLVCAANPWDHAPRDLLQCARRRGASRLVLVLHDLLPWEVPHLTAGREVRSFIEDMLAVLDRASRIVAVSRHAAECYAAATTQQQDPARIVVARPSIPAAFLAPNPGRPPPGLRDRPFVLFCSTIEIRKNHVLLLHVWEQLRRVLPEERMPLLVLAGKFGWGVDAVRLTLERNWRLAPNLLVLTTVADDELVWLYRNARFTVFPSMAEGYGMPVAESLACGTPVVIADHPALRAAAEDLMPALQPLDFHAWEAEISRLLADDAYLARLREQARRYRGPAPAELARAVEAAARDAVPLSAPTELNNQPCADTLSFRPRVLGSTLG